MRRRWRERLRIPARLVSAVLAGGCGASPLLVPGDGGAPIDGVAPSVMDATLTVATDSATTMPLDATMILPLDATMILPMDATMIMPLVDLRQPTSGTPCPNPGPGQCMACSPSECIVSPFDGGADSGLPRCIC